ncbi:hypothetical protein niasHT_000591 [Heterodera trifolii]|uniref:B30.2/SPRY domain-containing protein n=1 Tax=Heterodera trifolii TaxID=157864 RepID=A0ABD2LYZ0_9BILA
MSISINSINCVDDLTQAAENGKVNGDVISLDNNGQFDGKNSESIADQQQFKELRQKFAKMEMELKMAKLELENKEQKLKLHELIGEQKALKEKVTKIEQKNAIFPSLSTSEEISVLIARIAELNRANTVEPSIASSCDGNDAAEERFSQLQNDQKEIFEKINELEKQQKEQTKANADQLSKILEKINEMEKQQHEEITTKANSDQFSKIQKDQKILMEKVSELEKEQKQKQRKAFLNFQQNYWDANFCHDKLEIIGKKNLTVHHKGNTSGCGYVFAKHPILLNNNSSDNFYYEILVKNKKSWFISFGFAVKQQHQLEGTIHSSKGTYAYECNGEIYINGERKGRNAEYSYCTGDTVGIGVNSATQQIIFTKNGLRLDFFDFLVGPSFSDDSFHPFVFLLLSDDKIEANFGPIFKFDLTTL